MKKYNVAVIGYGWVATAHIQAINATSNAQVTAIYSSRPQDNATLSARHGSPIEAFTDLTALLKRPDPLVRTFTENLLAYGLGRRAEYFDQPMIRAITRAAAAQDYRMSAFILGVVKSDAFRLKRAEPVPTETATSVAQR